MASSIETQVRSELSSLEAIVTAVDKLSTISASLSRDDMEDFAYIAGFLADQLRVQFESFHKTISQRLLPLVADVKAVNLD
jgi:hypothetical protein